ncbi:MAG: ParB/RepB/Spo0J family partition protein [Gammaproteobacteria bacterium]|nr:ParB/RepB/Spo0J family partition protein [Gammaproteobacteria bacterium]
MSGGRKGLGRGLEALLGSGAKDVGTVTASVSAPETEYRTLPIDRLRRGRYQPRRDMDPEALEQLAESIRHQGLMQPLVVRRLEGEDYEIIAGERRWRAAQMAGFHEVPVLLKVVDDETALALALIENIQREDLNAMEEAIALVRLQDEFGLNQQQVATAVGKSRAAVANLMRLVKLAPEVQELLARGDLEMGHARALLSLAQSDQLVAARRVVAGGLTVRQTEALARKWQAPETTSAPARQDPDIARLEEDLSNRLGAAVDLRHGSSGSGRLVIHYTSLDVLDGIIARIR